MRKNVLALSLGLLATVALSAPAFAQSAERGGLGIGLSVGGANGLNTNASLGGASGVNTDANASVGGSRGVKVDAQASAGAATASTPMPISPLAVATGSTLRLTPVSVADVA